MFPNSIGSGFSPCAKRGRARASHTGTSVSPTNNILGQFNFGRDGCGRDTLENRPRNLFETPTRNCTTFAVPLSPYHFLVPLRYRHKCNENAISTFPDLTFRNTMKIDDFSTFPRLRFSNAMKINEILTFPELTLRNAMKINTNSKFRDLR